MRFLLALFALFAFAFTAPASRADSWNPPERATYLSADRRLRFTVTPRDVIDEGAYWTEVRRLGPERAGQRPGGNAQARGLLERQRGGGRWAKVWEAPLINPVGPPRVLVIDGGRHVVTFGDWHGYGVGGHAVTIYGPGGRLVRTFALSDFLPEDYVIHLPRTAGSVSWDGKHRASQDGQRLVLQVVTPLPPRPDERERRFVEVDIRLADGVVIPPAGPAWDRALAKLSAYAESRKADAAR